MNQAKPRKVLHVVGGLNRGGIETWLLQMVQNIDRSRYQIDILVDSDEPYDYTEDFRAAGCRIIPCYFPQKRVSYIGRLFSTLRRFGPYDIIHSHVDNRSGLNCLVARMCGIQTRIIHNYPPSELKRASLTRDLYRQISFCCARHGATHFLACSKTSTVSFLKLSRLRPIGSRVLYSSVELQKYDRKVNRSKIRQKLGLPDEIPLVAYVARFFPHKNHQQIFRIADRINKAGKRMHFVLAGSYGPLRESIAAQTRKRQDFSILFGLEDISELLLASDIFLFPSLHEGFGIVAIEASAAGLPVIATDLASIKEACAPSHRSLMFAPDDDDKACNSLELVISDDDLRRSLQTDAKTWASQFSVHSSLENLVSFYEDALLASQKK